MSCVPYDCIWADFDVRRSRGRVLQSCCVYCREWSVEDEFRDLTASGIKLLHSLVVQQMILLYLLPDGSRVSRLWLGWLLSFSILWAPCRHVTPPDVTDALLMAPSDVLVLIIHFGAFLFWATHESCQFGMFGNWTFLSFHRKQGFLCAFPSCFSCSKSRFFYLTMY